MKFTCTVTIGRNIGDEPMSDKLWAEFRGDIEFTLNNYDVPLSDRYTMDALTAAGRYGDISEESATYVFAADVRTIANIRPQLIKLARHYSQECIALVIGNTELIGLDS